MLPRGKMMFLAHFSPSVETNEQPVLVTLTNVFSEIPGPRFEIIIEATPIGAPVRFIVFRGTPTQSRV